MAPPAALPQVGGAGAPRKECLLRFDCLHHLAQSALPAALLVFAARAAGTGGVPAEAPVSDRCLGGLCRPDDQFRARGKQDLGDTIRDQVRGLQVDLVDLVIGELAGPLVDILQRHQEDQGRSCLFVGLLQQGLPSVGPQAQRASESIDPWFPEDFVTVPIDLIDRLDPRGFCQCRGDPVVVVHDRRDRRFRSR